MSLSFSSQVGLEGDKIMMNNNLPSNMLPVMMGLFLSACVTINIYFPAAAAEKAADKIIEEVWQLDREKKDE
ncbi:MAG: hypothetical protein KIS65_02750 [Nitrosomonas sp.]|nr:hypothetical protein [Nitrosomonas sp.]